MKLASFSNARPTATAVAFRIAVILGVALAAAGSARI